MCGLTREHVGINLLDTGCFGSVIRSYKVLVNRSTLLYTLVSGLADDGVMSGELTDPQACWYPLITTFW